MLSAVLEKQFDGYVAIEDGSIWTRDDLWARVAAFLAEAQGERVAKTRPGRPARGPGSAGLAQDVADRIAMIREAYNEVSIRKRRPAMRSEVASALKVSATTLWRLRKQCCLGWPP